MFTNPAVYYKHRNNWCVFRGIEPLASIATFLFSIAADLLLRIIEVVAKFAILLGCAASHNWFPVLITWHTIPTLL